MVDVIPFFEAHGLMGYYNFSVSAGGIVLVTIGFIIALLIMAMLIPDLNNGFVLIHIVGFYIMFYAVAMPIMPVIVFVCLVLSLFLLFCKLHPAIRISRNRNYSIYSIERIGMPGDKKYIVQYNGNIITSYYPEVNFLHDTAEEAKVRMETAKRLQLTGEIQNAALNGDPELIAKLKLDPDFLTDKMKNETICNDRPGLQRNSRKYITDLLKKYHNLTIK